MPLIYETKSEKKYDLIILAHCNVKTQKERVLKRDKISNLLFEKIVASQLSFCDKMNFKPYVINTNNRSIILIKVFLFLIKTLFKLRLRNEKKKVSTDTETIY